MENELDMDFDGVFRFSNNSDEDFVKMWNSVEYTFPAHTRTPMIIRGCTPEEIQEIRKRWAYAWAEREWFKSEDHKRLNAQPNSRGGRDDTVLDALIQSCLDPLPTGKATVKEVPIKGIKTKATKAVGGDDNLNEVFKEETKEGNIQRMGKMPDRAI
jgi:hypothetical protein